MACDIENIINAINEMHTEFELSFDYVSALTAVRDLMNLRGNTEAVERIDKAIGNKTEMVADEAAPSVVLSNKSSRKKADSLFNETSETVSELDPDIATLGLPEAGNDILSNAIDCITT